MRNRILRLFVFSKQIRFLALLVAAAVLLGTAAHADIYQWEYVDPLDPSQGKQPSTTPCTDGVGLTPRPRMNAEDRDLAQAYLASYDLSDANFNGAILADGYLSRANLTNAWFASATLIGADLGSANLRSAHINEASLTGTDMTNTEVRGASFYGATGLTPEQVYSTASYQAGDLTGVQLGLHNLSGWNFSGQVLNGVSFLRATVNGADFTNADVRGASFYEAVGLTAEQLYSTSSYQMGDLTSLSLYGLDLTGWNFATQNLTDGGFVYATMTGADLSDANLGGANFISATLSAAKFTNANVSGANFSLVSGGTGLTSEQLYSTTSYQTGDLVGIGLARNNLAGWDFAERDLGGANFGGATLTDANLRGANLTNAQFRSASRPWEPAELSGVNFTDAWIAGAGFSGTGLTTAQLRSTASYKAGNLTGIDFSSNDFAGWDFAGLNLTGADFSSTELVDANLSSTNLTGASFVVAAMSEADLTNAEILGADFRDSDFTSIQLISTASYQRGDLTDVSLWSIDLSAVDFTDIEIRGANLGLTRLTVTQLYSTANYRRGDLSRVDMSGNDLSDGNFADQDLTYSSFWWTTIVGADLSNARIIGANFESSDITLAQLYSTGSYQSSDLTRVSLGLNDLSGVDLADMTLTSADLAGANLTGGDLSGANLKGAAFPASTLVDANLSGANLTGTSYWYVPGPHANLSNADLTGADARGATDMDTALSQTQNFIHPDGHVEGLHISTGETMRLWDFDLTAVEIWHGGFYGDIQIDIVVEDSLTIDSSGTLQIIFEDEEWRSTILFESGIPVTLDGTLKLLIDEDINPLTLVGATYQLFDWTGVSPVGVFDSIISHPGTVWDVSSLYTTGEVALMAVPEPTMPILLVLGATLLAVCRAHVPKGNRRRTMLAPRLCAAVLVVALLPSTARAITFGEWATSRGYSPGDSMPATLDASDAFIDSLDGIEDYDWTHTTQLNLSNNQLTSIATGSFVGLTNVHSLHLNDNLISTVEAGARR